MSEHDNEPDIIELENNEGEKLRLSVERYFFYNGDEYVLLSDDCGQELPAEEISHYVMRVKPLPEEDGEEMEEFVPVEDELMDKLLDVIENTLSEEVDEDDD